MTSQEVIQSSCPDDESLAGLIENRLAEPAREQIERHVALCPTCIDVVAAASSSVAATLQPRDAAGRALARALAPHDRRTAALRKGQAVRRRLALAAALLLVSTATLGYATARVGLASARAEITRRAGDTLGLPVAIGRIALSLGDDWRSLKLRLTDVRVLAGSAGALLESDVDIALAVAPLWAGAIDVERINLIDPVLELEQAAPTSPPPAESRTRVVFDTSRAAALVAGGPPIRVENGTLELRMSGSPPLRVQRLSAQSVRDGDLARFTLAGSTVGGLITATGTLAAGNTRTLTVTVGGHGLDLAGLPYLREFATGNADLRLTIFEHGSGPQLAGKILVRHGQTLGGNPIPVLLGAAGRAGLVGELAPTLTGDQLPFEEARAAFAWRDGAWRISRGLVSGAGVELAGTLRVTPEADIEGAAIVRLAQDPAGSVTLAFTIAGTVDSPDFALH